MPVCGRIDDGSTLAAVYAAETTYLTFEAVISGFVEEYLLAQLHGLDEPLALVLDVTSRRQEGHIRVPKLTRCCICKFFATFASKHGVVSNLVHIKFEIRRGLDRGFT